MSNWAVVKESDNICTNRVRDDGFFIPEGTVFYAKRAAGAPSSGALYIECYGGAP